MDLSELVEAIDTLNAPDAFKCGFTLLQWQTIENYLIPFEMKAGEVLIEQGETDRVCYFLGRGSLQVYVTGGPPGASRIAIVRAGAIVGEPSLFGDQPRMASVSTLTPCTLWALSGQRFEQMAQRVPALALDFLRAAGNVMAIRMRATLVRQTPFT
ncbi:cyclic nucleotide-binding domain-containing protein [Piscinibacter sakaiensis]|uniref:Cyclic nucleotide-binding domain-containing protein n=1 Tax=Piscinibacter sakaiensis TaxID=1547922 RepID=A0A0K8P567_PISS1|nr:cyclic nucleotide-binding domain-containing protein [Piscinibacter sakaiensis]GAP37848.1 hypothetical protein ISF6_3793 [Piscinibacter sakaiensis]